MSPVEIRSVGPADQIWAFDDKEPMVRHGRYDSTRVDPFPAYPHDRDIVRQGLEACATRWPLPWPVLGIVSSLECVTRTNASAHTDWDYSSTLDPRPVKQGRIFFSGKRIPPHPALTRYLCAHEYGHLVEVVLDPHDPAVRLREYAQLPGRALASMSAAGGRWHDALQEVFACDFRRIIMRAELEFWPHAGVTPPEELPEVIAWWAARDPQAPDRPIQ